MKLKKYGALLLLAGSLQAFAATETTISILNSKFATFSTLPKEKIIALVKHNVDVSLYRQVKAQVMFNREMQPDYVLVYLFSKRYHRVDFAKIRVDANYNQLAFNAHYHLEASDSMQQPGINREDAKCPDPSIEFIAFAPNDDSLEQQITIGVAIVAKNHGLKTISLLKEEATRTNYLNYMRCPKLKGNFYDGDADPESITTVDGVITATDMDEILNNQFQYKVTNIWLACEAFNDPMKRTMLDVTESQKYAAGINDLLIGPSDRAAACTMKRAINHKPMTETFAACYARYDIADDHWGFDGKGSNFFGA